MSRSLARLLPLALAASVGVGCHKPQPTITMNAPPGGEQEGGVAEFFAYHNDQGMMADLSIADIHFVANSAYLSGTGEARLERYAELLATTGGTLRYETRLNDPELVDARLRTAREFLMQVSPGNRTVDVALGMPAGRGMSAVEAAGGRGVAQQPEPRNSAYKLAGDSGGTGGGS